MARLFVDVALQAEAELSLPPGAARHVQVLRLQPGDHVTLFNGHGGQWQAEVLRMGRQSVEVRVLTHDPVERELALAVTLVVGMPANDRFDWLVEKATELGVQAIEPVMYERSVLRLSGERAERKREHWQGVAIAAAEQCGRTRVPQIAPVRTLPQALGAHAQAAAQHPAVPHNADCLLSLAEAIPVTTYLQRLQTLQASPPTQPIQPTREGLALRVFSGPEGGLSGAEEALIRARGAQAISLGPRILRAETAPLALLASLALLPEEPAVNATA